MSWQVDVTDPAVSGLRQILTSTRSRFEARQATIYRATLFVALGDLGSGPDVAGSVSRQDPQLGLRTLHVARRGRRGRHVLLYRVASPQVIQVLRILHDAMDFARHLLPSI